MKKLTRAEKVRAGKEKPATKPRHQQPQENDVKALADKYNTNRR